MPSTRSHKMRANAAAVVAAGLSSVFILAGAHANPEVWRFEWPQTDFANTSIEYETILSGGPPKDGIPAIDDPVFGTIAEAEGFFEGNEPVITVAVDGVAKAYPLSIMTWHEIVNDEIGGVPVSVTYCPLCNSAVAFDRRVGDEILDFGTTGKLRFSDLVMYDRQTESWWQQFIGEGIVGEHTGTLLTMLPVRVESFSAFSERFPDGQVLRIPENVRRQYGSNPYAGYDTSPRPFLFDGTMPDGIAPLAYVVAVEDEAWSLDLLQAEGSIETDELLISWTPGMASALDARVISQGRDLGNVVVQRKTDGGLEDAVHDLTFAFNFNAFNPGATIHK